VLRPVSARFQTPLTFMLHVHRTDPAKDDPGAHHRAGVMRFRRRGATGRKALAHVQQSTIVREA
jgi:hypothetical protein